MEKEDLYTSTGVKFWKHPEQMKTYKKGRGNTIISTHISPEGNCNLACKFCSVAKRNKHGRIPLNIIKDYILKLKTRGLQACILTGGGEPSLYPKFNELVKWLKDDMELEVALITNGTVKIDKEILDRFTWVRISLNQIPNWENKIVISKIKGTLGFSVVYVDQNLDFFRKALKLCKKLDGKYIRILPNCLNKGDNLNKKHNKIDQIITKLKSKIFFHQNKVHNTPQCRICHQGYFRPYLSEVDNGTIYLCDSIPLIDNFEYFAEKYAVCKPYEILDFLDGKIKPKFDPSIDCNGCVFTDTVNMLDDWKKGKIDLIDYYKNKEIQHKNFV